MAKEMTYQGRWCPSWSLTTKEQENAKVLSAFTLLNNHYFCRRCGSAISNDWQLPDGRFYCRGCLIFGRLTETDKLVYFLASSFPQKNHMTWTGKLTKNQQKVSDQLVKAYDTKKPTLIEAVTGAGKTEMIYALVNRVLSQGQQVCIASPRVDVCIELYQRFKVNFTCPICLLHANSQEQLEAPLVIATTHQLLNYYHCFELIIIDEVDAFPYVDNKLLYHGVDNALKEEGFKVFLTATKTETLVKEVKRGKLQELNLSRRFHGHPLPVPKCIWLGSFEKQLQKHRLSRRLRFYLNQQLKTPYPLLLFMPDIRLGQQLTKLLITLYPNVSISFVSSKTKERLERVTAFRDGKYRILVTTTILERGVTFPCVDVFVLMANHRLYSSSSLVQIAGRAGRSTERPTGDVYYFHGGKTRAMRRSIAAICSMNTRGGFK